MRKPPRLPLEALAPYLLEDPGTPSPRSAPPAESPAPAQPPFDAARVFGNDHPLEIEVGCGKGLFLITAAQARPEHNFLGIEVFRALQLYIATRLAKRRLTNARVALADARRFLHTCVPARCAAVLHVYFPDPWWKTRHHKRRLWTPEFTQDCIRVLRPGGRLSIATDVPAYDAHIRALIEARPELRLCERHEGSGPPRPEDTVTNFERKARERGGRVFRAVYERMEESSPREEDRNARVAASGNP